jgi:lathosterol oxidase
VSLITPFLWQMTTQNSSYSATLREAKFNKDYPAAKHIWREIPYSVCTVLMGTFIEAFLMTLYATGTITNYYLDISEYPIAFLAVILTQPIWRNTHFYFVHRFMHKWNTTWFPDIGEWMYKHVHSVHHQSRNFQPWSGISMHPVEGFLYETACMLPCLVFHHPVMINLVKIEENLAAVVGHDGHDFPGTGDWFHLVHHTKINCNYGAPLLPWDYIFGSIDYADESDVSD